VSRRHVAGVVVAALALGTAASAVAATSDPVGPSFDGRGRLVQAPYAPSQAAPRESRAEITRLFLALPKVASWLDRYPAAPETDATFDPKTRNWTVRVWSGAAGEIARGTIEEGSLRIVSAYTGPQVAWSMARGTPGSFGGRLVNNPAVWLALCALFLLGLVNWRRPLTLRTVDLLALLSFSVSLWFFNEGRIFASVSLVYPGLVYLLARTAWIGVRGRAGVAPASVWPVWVLAAATLFLCGFRVGLNVEAERSVIDVGYASVIGADRILNGEAPYGHMPVRGSRTACGPAGADGEIRDRIQTNGRCESSNERGDTYGPVAYLAYVPAVAVLGWSGLWDSLPAAHATSLLFDLLCVVGLALVGRRFGGDRLGATLAFGWAAYPFTLYVSNANTNDAIMPAFLIWGLWLVTRPGARGAFTALAGWTKFAALAVVPLWLTYPNGPTRRGLVGFALGFGVATLAVFSILLLEPDLPHAVSVFYDRTIGFQRSRESPFSIWGWGQYHARGIPDLGHVQTGLQMTLVAFSLFVALRPREKGPLELAALTGALLLGVQLVLTHWFYLYLPWALPFVLLALFLPRTAARVEETA
jgi:hypothetical protein